MLIMPFIFDSRYLFSASKAWDTSSSDTGVMSVFRGVWLPIVLFISSKLLPFTDWRAPTGSYYVTSISFRPRF